MYLSVFVGLELNGILIVEMLFQFFVAEFHLLNDQEPLMNIFSLMGSGFQIVILTLETLKN